MFLIILLIILLIIISILFNYRDNFNNLNDAMVDNNPFYSKYFDKYFNDTLTYDNPYYTYYYNDSINQSKISENSEDIVNQIDKVDYGNVKLGIQKCHENCQGQCRQLGYDGIGICNSSIYNKYDLGTLYNNPTFIR